jgi:hypothetical protein
MPAGDALGLLSSARLPWLIRQLEHRYDVVLVHGPPALETVDAVALSTQTSAALLVIESCSTLCKRAVEALTLLRKAQVEVLGAVLTQARALAGDAHLGFARSGSTSAPVGAADDGPDVEPEPEASPGSRSQTGDHSSDYAAAYLRQSERVGLQGGLLCAAREPETRVPVELRFSEPVAAPQSAPIDVAEGHLVTLEELFIEPSVSADNVPGRASYGAPGSALPARGSKAGRAGRLSRRTAHGRGVEPR